MRGGRGWFRKVFGLCHQAGSYSQDRQQHTCCRQPRQRMPCLPMRQNTLKPLIHLKAPRNRAPAGCGRCQSQNSAISRFHSAADRQG